MGKGGQELILGGVGGERYLVRLLEFPLHLLAFGNIMRPPDEDAPLSQPRLADRQADRKQGAILAKRHDLAPDADDFFDARAPVVLQILIVVLAVGRGHQAADVTAHKFLGAVAKELFSGGIDRFYDPPFINGDDTVHGRFKNGPVAFLALFDRRGLGIEGLCHGPCILGLHRPAGGPVHFFTNPDHQKISEDEHQKTDHFDGRFDRQNTHRFDPIESGDSG